MLSVNVFKYSMVSLSVVCLNYFKVMRWGGVIGRIFKLFFPVAGIGGLLNAVCIET